MQENLTLLYANDKGADQPVPSSACASAQSNQRHVCPVMISFIGGH